MIDLKNFVKHYKDFPTKGVDFLDIFPLFQSETLTNELRIQLLSKIKSQFIAVPESRGFLLGSLVLGNQVMGLIPFRKHNKLPGRKVAVQFQKEYGIDSLEFRPKDLQQVFESQKHSVTILDDVLATGGTSFAMASTLEEYGVSVENFVFITDVPVLKGKELLSEIAPVSLLYEN